MSFNDKHEQTYVVDYLNPATGYLFGMQQVQAKTAQRAVDIVREQFKQEGINIQIKTCRAMIDMAGRWE